MISCKKCHSSKCIKSGIVANKQRYKCKDCNATFREGDNRTNEKIIAKKPVDPTLCYGKRLLSHARIRPKHLPYLSLQMDMRVCKITT